MSAHEDVEPCSICQRQHVGGDAGHAEYQARADDLITSTPDVELCWASYVTAGSDPYGTSCDLPAGHRGSHEGEHPLRDDARLSWSGGGYCAGDPLPRTHVRVIDTTTNTERLTP